MRNAFLPDWSFSSPRLETDLVSSVSPCLRVRRSRSSESTSWRGLFERSEFPRHLIRDGSGGTRKRMIKTSVRGVLGPLPCSRTHVYAARAKASAALLTNVLIIRCRAAHGQTWFWVLLPKQKDFVCRGETLHLIILENNLARGG